MGLHNSLAKNSSDFGRFRLKLAQFGNVVYLFTSIIGHLCLFALHYPFVNLSFLANVVDILVFKLIEASVHDFRFVIIECYRYTLESYVFLRIQAMSAICG